MQYNRNYLYGYDYDYPNAIHDENWFMSEEPGAQLEINLFRWMRFSPGISYRKTYGSCRILCLIMISATGHIMLP